MKRILLLLSLLLLAGEVSARRVGVYCIFADGTESVFEDENLKVVVGIDNGKPCWLVLNKSDKTIYIDKANSFAYENNTPTCLFTNAVYTTGQERERGMGLNLGSVANAVGIGGIAGTLMSGMTVGGGNTTQNSTMIQEQRILMLAPKAVYRLYDWELIGAQNQILKSIAIQPRKVGRTWHFEEVSTPYSIRGHLRYSLTEDFTQTKDVSVSNHVTDIVLDKAKSINKPNKAVAVNKAEYSQYGKICFRDGMNWGAAAGVYFGSIAVIGTVTAVIAAGA